MPMVADIGVIGGSGLYSFINDVIEVEIDTPYGKPSDKIAIADIYNKKVAFLPRHGKKHIYPPHLVPYRANIHALHQLGVKKIIGVNACGSLQPNIKPGEFVVCDQFVDRTWGRNDTFFEGPKVEHASPADPYCERLRETAIKACETEGITVHKKGTIVVIQGPRFSTRAESKWFSKMGWEVINMTQYPECYLAKELDICYANISLITDYDAGLEGNNDIKPVTHDEVIKVFNENNQKVIKVLHRILQSIDTNQDCK